MYYSRLYKLQWLKRGTAMPRLYLEVVGNLAYRCSDSSPRYMRENHYAI